MNNNSAPLFWLAGLIAALTAVGWLVGVLPSKYALVRRRDGVLAFNLVGGIWLGFAPALALLGLRGLS